MAAVTQATSCCSVVTVMRTGSVYIDRLNDRGTHRRTERRRERERERERKRERERERRVVEVKLGS